MRDDGIIDNITSYYQSAHLFFPAIGTEIIMTIEVISIYSSTIAMNFFFIKDSAIKKSVKGQCHEIFDFWFFHESVSPKPLSIPLRPFQIFSKICGDIRSSRLTTGVINDKNLQ
jgi:hypothetical protein